MAQQKATSSRPEEAFRSGYHLIKRGVHKPAASSSLERLEKGIVKSCPLLVVISWSPIALYFRKLKLVFPTGNRKLVIHRDH